MGKSLVARHRASLPACVPRHTDYHHDRLRVRRCLIEAIRRIVLVDLVHRAGLRGWHLHLASMASVFLCIGLWIRAKTHDQSERGNAERRALFVGLWPPMLWLMGDSLERRNSATSRRLRRP